MEKSGGGLGRPLARVSAPTERGRLVARGSAENPANRFERLAYAEDPEFVDDAPDDGESTPTLRTRYYRDPSRTLIARNESPDVGFDASINPYRGCSHGCVYCLSPDTPVLGGDLVWRPIGELRVGDELVGFDEFPKPARHRWKLRRARVEAIWWSRKPTLRLITRKAVVVTTAEHRWLAGPLPVWLRTDQLMLGASLLHIDGVALDRMRHADRISAVARTATAGCASLSRPTKQRSWKMEFDPIEAIEPGPERDVVDIQSSTGTFYAAGLATHNCYARPTHEYLGLSAGLDFETHILVKEDAPALLEKTLRAPSWQPEVIAISGVTDPYQPVERKLRITRGCLAVLAKYRNPCSIITKSSLVTRDIDLLRELAEHDAVFVNVSITSLDDHIRRVMEPRASPPHERLRAVEALANAGIPVGVMVAPIVPGLTDSEIPALVAAAANAGARTVHRVMLRLPHGVADLFEAWLVRHFPDRAAKVMSRIRSMRGGNRYDSRFFTRQRGEGVFADQIADLFELACRRAGVNQDPPKLSTAAFRRPGGEQLALL
jgi:DNA repair photolyase